MYALLESFGDVPARWPRLSLAGRLTYAKLRFLVESDRALYPEALLPLDVFQPTAVLAAVPLPR